MSRLESQPIFFCVLYTWQKTTFKALMIKTLWTVNTRGLCQPVRSAHMRVYMVHFVNDHNSSSTIPEAQILYIL